jgi:hypothetical protein
MASSSSSRKVSGLTPTAVFALATPKSLIDRCVHTGICACLSSCVVAFTRHGLSVEYIHDRDFKLGLEKYIAATGVQAIILGTRRCVVKRWRMPPVAPPYCPAPLTLWTAVPLHCSTCPD